MSMFPTGYNASWSGGSNAIPFFKQPQQPGRMPIRQPVSSPGMGIPERTPPNLSPLPGKGSGYRIQPGRNVGDLSKPVKKKNQGDLVGQRPPVHTPQPTPSPQIGQGSLIPYPDPQAIMERLRQVQLQRQMEQQNLMSNPSYRYAPFFKNQQPVMQQQPVNNILASILQNPQILQRIRMLSAGLA